MIKNWKITWYMRLIRPFTLLAPVTVSVSIMTASFFYNNHNPEFNLRLLYLILSASLSLGILNGASNALNQVSDVETDKISKPYRPIPRGMVTTREATTISLALYTASFLISTQINMLFCLLTTTIILFTVSYSLPPRFKNHLFFNQIWIAIPRGLLGILASWSVFGSPFDKPAIYMGLITTFFLFGGSITKDITDADADKKNGAHTLINTYGVKEAGFIVFPFMFTPFIMTPILINTGLISINLWPLTLFIIPVTMIFYLMIKDSKKTKKFENTFSWCLMYLTYLSLAFIFSVLTILDSITL